MSVVGVYAEQTLSAEEVKQLLDMLVSRSEEATFTPWNAVLFLHYEISFCVNEVTAIRNTAYSHGDQVEVAMRPGHILLRGAYEPGAYEVPLLATPDVQEQLRRRDVLDVLWEHRRRNSGN